MESKPPTENRHCREHRRRRNRRKICGHLIPSERGGRGKWNIIRHNQTEDHESDDVPSVNCDHFCAYRDTNARNRRRIELRIE